jgi:hypothetical protein
MRNLIIAAILMVIGLSVAGNGPDMEHPVVPQETIEHKCSDSTHQECDGSCPCDGVGCQYDTSNSK